MRECVSERAAEVGAWLEARALELLEHAEELMLGNGMMGRDLGATDIDGKRELTHGMRVTFKADRASLTLAAAPTGGERAPRPIARVVFEPRRPTTPDFHPASFRAPPEHANHGLVLRLRKSRLERKIALEVGSLGVLDPRVEAARAAEPDGSGSPFGERAFSWFGGAPADEQARELKLKKLADAVSSAEKYCKWLSDNGGKANWTFGYRSCQLNDFCLLAEHFKEANPQFVDGRWFRFDAPDFTDAVVDFFLECHGPLSITDIKSYCRELRAKERLEQEGQRSPAEIKRLAAEEAEGLDKLEKKVVKLGGEAPDLRGWKVSFSGNTWYFNGPGGEPYRSISKAAAAIINGTVSTYGDDPLKAFTVDELRAKCKEQGLKQTGTKKELFSRLKNAEKGIFDRPTRKLDDPLEAFTVDQLKAKSRDTGAALWRDVALRLSKSRSNWAQPNLSRVSRYAPEGATVVVPGKLLGSGDVAGAPTIVAYSVSAGARAKVEAAGGRVMSLRELMDENPKGSGVVILA